MGSESPPSCQSNTVRWPNCTPVPGFAIPIKVPFRWLMSLWRRKKRWRLCGSVSGMSQKVNYIRISAEQNLSPLKENTADGCALNWAGMFWSDPKWISACALHNQNLMPFRTGKAIFFVFILQTYWWEAFFQLLENMLFVKNWEANFDNC